MLAPISLKSGFSLIEVLISLLLGSLLLAMIISLYVTNVSAGHKGMKLSRFHADIQSLVGVIENDIRRAGFGGSDFMVGQTNNKVVDSINNGTQHCIVYAYNYNHAVAALPSHFMAFRYSSTSHSVQFGRGLNSQAINCYSSGSWVNLTDPKFLKVTELSFVESIASNSQATMRSVEVTIKAQLKSNSEYTHQITTKVQVRNPEFH